MITTNKIQPKLTRADELKIEIDELDISFTNGMIDRIDYNEKRTSLVSELNKELSVKTMNTNRIKPKEFPDSFPELDKYPYKPRDLSKLGIITTGNYQQKLGRYTENDKRKRLMEKVRMQKEEQKRAKALEKDKLTKPETEIKLNKKKTGRSKKKED